MFAKPLVKPEMFIIEKVNHTNILPNSCKELPGSQVPGAKAVCTIIQILIMKGLIWFITSHALLGPAPTNGSWSVSKSEAKR